MWCGWLPFTGFWWVVPLAGMLICVGFCLFAFRRMAGGGGCGCMGGHGDNGDART